MPTQFAHFPLKGPILGAFNQTRPDRIRAHVGPFFAAAFSAAQLPVPIIPLPNQSRSIFPHGGTGSTRSFRSGRRESRLSRNNIFGGLGSTRAVRSGKRSESFFLPNHQAFPIGHPFGQRGIVEASRRAKEMHVVRHDYIAPDPPIARVCPSGEEHRVHMRIGQNRAAILRADRHEHQDRLVPQFNDRLMRGSMAGGAFAVSHGSEFRISAFWRNAFHGVRVPIPIPARVEAGPSRKPNRPPPRLCASAQTPGFSVSNDCVPFASLAPFALEGFSIPARVEAGSPQLRHSCSSVVVPCFGSPSHAVKYRPPRPPVSCPSRTVTTPFTHTPDTPSQN